MNTIAYIKDLLVGLVPLVRVGILRPMNPWRLLRIAATVARYGFTPTGLIEIAALRCAKQPAVIDDWGTLTFAQLRQQSESLARGLIADGIPENSRVGILARNHRYFPILFGAAGRMGLHVVLLNTGASAPQLNDVIAEQKLKAIVVDEEFLHLVEQCTLQDVEVLVTGRSQFNNSAAAQTSSTPVAQTLKSYGVYKSIHEVILSGSIGKTRWSSRAKSHKLALRPTPGKTIVLTSGTTGTPKGAKRPEPKDWLPASAITSVFPVKQHEKMLLTTPLFHTWGLSSYLLHLALCSTVILESQPKPETIMRKVKEHQVQALYVVPTILQRIIESDEARAYNPVEHLLLIAVSGSAMTENLVREALNVFGAVVYNLYGTTETAWTTIATPGHLMRYPRTAGKPPLGTEVKVLDEHMREVPPDTVGCIYSGNGFTFEGYTRDGHDKERCGNLICTGDLGYFNKDKLLFVEGRQDDMIVSGGENVYPLEVENVITGLTGVRDSAVLGVDDEKFGKRFAAYVVRDDTTPEITADDIRTAVKERLSRFSVPRDVIFIDQLPRNATGKVVPALLKKISK